MSSCAGVVSHFVLFSSNDMTSVANRTHNTDRVTIATPIRARTIGLFFFGCSILLVFSSIMMQL